MLATGLLCLPAVPVALYGHVPALLFPLAAVETPATALLLVSLGLSPLAVGLLGLSVPVGVAVEGRDLRSSLRRAPSRLRSRPGLALRALSAVLLWWLLGGATLLVGLAIVLLGVALLIVAIGLLLIPAGVGVCLLAVFPLAAGHAYYRLLTLRP